MRDRNEERQREGNHSQREGRKRRIVVGVGCGSTLIFIQRKSVGSGGRD